MMIMTVIMMIIISLTVSPRITLNSLMFQSGKCDSFMMVTWMIMIMINNDSDDSDDGYLDVSIVDRLRVIRPVLVTLLPPLLHTPETIICNSNGF